MTIIEDCIRYPSVLGFLIMVNNSLNLRLNVPFCTVEYLGESDGIAQASIVIDETKTSEYKGSMVVDYQKVKLSDWFPNLVLPSKPPFRLSSVFDTVAKTADIGISMLDIQDQEVLTNTGIITARPDSLFWTGSVNFITE